MKKIPLFKVAMDPQAKDEVAKVLSSGYIGQGPKVEEFEGLFQKLVGTAVRPLATGSCTAALILALKTLSIGPGDLVVCAPMTCSATCQAIVQVGAQIVWADINPQTGLIDPVSVALAIGKCPKKPSAIMSVDWGGTLCDYQTLKQIGKHEGIPIIQDAAHCLQIGSDHGDYVAWSFGPIKHLTMGDGGALLTPDEELSSWAAERGYGTVYKKAKLLRWFGIDRDSGDSFRCRNEIYLPGAKYHVNDINAAIGLSNLQLAVVNVEKARENALYYNQVLKDLPIVLPPVRDTNSWWLYSLVAPGMRDKLVNYLESEGISASPVHARNDLQPVFETALRPVSLEGLDFFAGGQLSIPVGWWVTKAEREHIAKTIRQFFREGVVNGK